MKHKKALIIIFCLGIVCSVTSFGMKKRKSKNSTTDQRDAHKNWSTSLKNKIKKLKRALEPTTLDTDKTEEEKEFNKETALLLIKRYEKKHEELKKKINEYNPIQYYSKPRDKKVSLNSDLSRKKEELKKTIALKKKQYKEYEAPLFDLIFIADEDEKKREREKITKIREGIKTEIKKLEIERYELQQNSKQL